MIENCRYLAVKPSFLTIIIHILVFSQHKNLNTTKSCTAHRYTPLESIVYLAFKRVGISLLVS